MVERQTEFTERDHAQYAGGDVVFLDPSAYGIVDADARVEILHEGSGFFEGPNWVRDGTHGYLIFTDIAGNAIRKWAPDGTVTTVADGIFTGSDTSGAHLFDLGSRTVRLTGPNGTTLDASGHIVYCGYGTREVVRIERDGTRTVLANCFAGRRLNTPNDLVFRSDGALYFTDSAADVTRAGDDPDKGVPHSGVYLVKDGQIQLLIDNFTVPNGLAFSPDEKRLYVNDTRRKLIVRFDVQQDGSIGAGAVFSDMNDDPAAGVPDGMKVDIYGNVYCTGPAGLWIISAQGKHIATIKTPERLTNLAFGGGDGKTLFMTSPSYLYRVPLMQQGSELRHSVTE
jgi:gluconolactonase